MTTLIAYASKYGCAERCAASLAEKLTGKVELRNLVMTKTIDIADYDKVIIGGSIYAGRIQKAVSEFCRENRTPLTQKKVGLFVCGLLEDQAETELSNAFPPELQAKAVAKVFLGGELKFRKLNFMEKFMVKLVSKSDQNRPALEPDRDISTVSAERIAGLAQDMNTAK